MWKAMDHAQSMVAPVGIFFLSIYNDQGLRSRIWRAVKRTYNRLPESLRLPFAVLVMAPHELRGFALAAVQGQPHVYIRTWTEYARSRGMSSWHEIVDWVGGY